ncbi:hypothetical protein ACIRP7_23440 [Streptomyces sp. NPDC102270]|uniref:hypothetical protein n=1 Tax=Streptomyces sp. NPDC102270 TaxID=3366150 RepID=UPI0038009303
MHGISDPPFRAHFDQVLPELLRITGGRTVPAYNEDLHSTIITTAADLGRSVEASSTPTRSLPHLLAGDELAAARRIKLDVGQQPGFGSGMTCWRRLSMAAL